MDTRHATASSSSSYPSPVVPEMTEIQKRLKKFSENAEGGESVPMLRQNPSELSGMGVKSKNKKKRKKKKVVSDEEQEAAYESPADDSMAEVDSRPAAFSQSRINIMESGAMGFPPQEPACDDDNYSNNNFRGRGGGFGRGRGRGRGWGRGFRRGAPPENVGNYGPPFSEDMETYRYKEQFNQQPNRQYNFEGGPQYRPPHHDGRPAMNQHMPEPGPRFQRMQGPRIQQRQGAGYQQMEGPRSGYQQMQEFSPGYQQRQEHGPGFQQIQEHGPGFQQVQEHGPGFKPMQEHGPRFPQIQEHGPGFQHMQKHGPGFQQVQTHGPEFQQMHEHGPGFQQMQEHGPGFQQMQEHGPRFQQMQEHGPGFQQMQEHGPGFQQMQEHGPGFQQIQEHGPGFQQMQEQGPGFQQVQEPGQGYMGPLPENQQWGYPVPQNQIPPNFQSQPCIQNPSFTPQDFATMPIEPPPMHPVTQPPTQPTKQEIHLPLDPSHLSSIPIPPPPEHPPPPLNPPPPLSSIALPSDIPMPPPLSSNKEKSQTPTDELAKNDSEAHVNLETIDKPLSTDDKAVDMDVPALSPAEPEDTKNVTECIAENGETTLFIENKPIVGASPTAELMETESKVETSENLNQKDESTKISDTVETDNSQNKDSLQSKNPIKTTAQMLLEKIALKKKSMEGGSSDESGASSSEPSKSRLGTKPLLKPVSKFLLQQGYRLKQSPTSSQNETAKVQFSVKVGTGTMQKGNILHKTGDKVEAEDKSKTGARELYKPSVQDKMELLLETMTPRQRDNYLRFQAQKEREERRKQRELERNKEREEKEREEEEKKREKDTKDNKKRNEGEKSKDTEDKSKHRGEKDQTKESKERDEREKSKDKNDVDKCKEDRDRSKEDRDKNKEDRDKSKEDRDQSKEDRDKSKEDRDKSKEDRDKNKEDRDKNKEDRDKSKDRSERDKSKERKEEKGEYKSESKERGHGDRGKDKERNKNKHREEDKKEITEKDLEKSTVSVSHADDESNDNGKSNQERRDIKLSKTTESMTEDLQKDSKTDNQITKEESHSEKTELSDGKLHSLNTPIENKEKLVMSDVITEREKSISVEKSNENSKDSSVISKTSDKAINHTQIISDLKSPSRDNISDDWKVNVNSSVSKSDAISDTKSTRKKKSRWSSGPLPEEETPSSIPHPDNFTHVSPTQMPVAEKSSKLPIPPVLDIPIPTQSNKAQEKSYDPSHQANMDTTLPGFDPLPNDIPKQDIPLPITVPPFTAIPAQSNATVDKYLPVSAPSLLNISVAGKSNTELPVTVPTLSDIPMPVSQDAGQRPDAEVYSPDQPTGSPTTESGTREAADMEYSPSHPTEDYSPSRPTDTYSPEQVFQNKTENVMLTSQQSKDELKVEESSRNTDIIENCDEKMKKSKKSKKKSKNREKSPVLLELDKYSGEKQKSVEQQDEKDLKTLSSDKKDIFSWDSDDSVHEPVKLPDISNKYKRHSRYSRSRSRSKSPESKLEKSTKYRKKSLSRSRSKSIDSKRVEKKEKVKKSKRSPSPKHSRKSRSKSRSKSVDSIYDHSTSRKSSKSHKKSISPKRRKKSRSRSRSVSSDSKDRLSKNQKVPKSEKKSVHSKYSRSRSRSLDSDDEKVQRKKSSKSRSKKSVSPKRRKKSRSRSRSKSKSINSDSDTHKSRKSSKFSRRSSTPRNRSSPSRSRSRSLESKNRHKKNKKANKKSVSPKQIKSRSYTNSRSRSRSHDRKNDRRKNHKSRRSVSPKHRRGKNSPKPRRKLSNSSERSSSESPSPVRTKLHASKSGKTSKTRKRSESPKELRRSQSPRQHRKRSRTPKRSKKRSKSPQEKTTSKDDANNRNPSPDHVKHSCVSPHHSNIQKRNSTSPVMEKSGETTNPSVLPSKSESKLISSKELKLSSRNEDFSRKSMETCSVEEKGDKSKSSIFKEHLLSSNKLHSEMETKMETVSFEHAQPQSVKEGQTSSKPDEKSLQSCQTSMDSTPHSAQIETKLPDASAVSSRKGSTERSSSRSLSPDSIKEHKKSKKSKKAAKKAKKKEKKLMRKLKKQGEVTESVNTPVEVEDFDKSKNSLPGLKVCSSDANLENTMTVTENNENSQSVCEENKEIPAEVKKTKRRSWRSKRSNSDDDSQEVPTDNVAQRKLKRISLDVPSLANPSETINSADNTNQETSIISKDKQNNSFPSLEFSENRIFEKNENEISFSNQSDSVQSVEKQPNLKSIRRTSVGKTETSEEKIKRELKKLNIDMVKSAYDFDEDDQPRRRSRRSRSNKSPEKEMQDLKNDKSEADTSKSKKRSKAAHIIQEDSVDSELSQSGSCKLSCDSSDIAGDSEIESHIDKVENSRTRSSRRKKQSKPDDVAKSDICQKSEAASVTLDLNSIVLPHNKGSSKADKKHKAEEEKTRLNLKMESISMDKTEESNKSIVEKKRERVDHSSEQIAKKEKVTTSISSTKTGAKESKVSVTREPIKFALSKSAQPLSKSKWEEENSNDDEMDTEKEQFYMDSDDPEISFKLPADTKNSIDNEERHFEIISSRRDHVVEMKNQSASPEKTATELMDPENMSVKDRTSESSVNVEVDKPNPLKKSDPVFLDALQNPKELVKSEVFGKKEVELQENFNVNIFSGADNNETVDMECDSNSNSQEPIIIQEVKPESTENAESAVILSGIKKGSFSYLPKATNEQTVTPRLDQVLDIPLPTNGNKQQSDLEIPMPEGVSVKQCAVDHKKSETLKTSTDVQLPQESKTNVSVNIDISPPAENIGLTNVNLLHDKSEQDFIGENKKTEDSKLEKLNQMSEANFESKKVPELSAETLEELHHSDVSHLNVSNNAISTNSEENAGVDNGDIKSEEKSKGSDPSELHNKSTEISKQALLEKVNAKLKDSSKDRKFPKVPLGKVSLSPFPEKKSMDYEQESVAECKKMPVIKIGPIVMNTRKEAEVNVKGEAEVSVKGDLSEGEVKSESETEENLKTRRQFIEDKTSSISRLITPRTPDTQPTPSAFGLMAKKLLSPPEWTKDESEPENNPVDSQSEAETNQETVPPIWEIENTLQEKISNPSATNLESEVKLDDLEYDKRVNEFLKKTEKSAPTFEQKVDEFLKKVEKPKPTVERKFDEFLEKVRQPKVETATLEQKVDDFLKKTEKKDPKSNYDDYKSSKYSKDEYDRYKDRDHKDRDYKDRDYKDRDYKDRDYKDRSYRDRYDYKSRSRRDKEYDDRDRHRKRDRRDSRDRSRDRSRERYRRRDRSRSRSRSRDRDRRYEKRYKRSRHERDDRHRKGDSSDDDHRRRDDSSDDERYRSKHKTEKDSEKDTDTKEKKVDKLTDEWLKFESQLAAKKKMLAESSSAAKTVTTTQPTPPTSDFFQDAYGNYYPVSQATTYQQYPGMPAVPMDPNSGYQMQSSQSAHIQQHVPPHQMYPHDPYASVHPVTQQPAQAFAVPPTGQQMYNPQGQVIPPGQGITYNQDHSMQPQVQQPPHQQTVGAGPTLVYGQVPTQQPIQMPPVQQPVVPNAPVQSSVPQPMHTNYPVHPGHIMPNIVTSQPQPGFSQEGVPPFGQHQAPFPQSMDQSQDQNHIPQHAQSQNMANRPPLIGSHPRPQRFPVQNRPQKEMSPPIFSPPVRPKGYVPPQARKEAPSPVIKTEEEKSEEKSAEKVETEPQQLQQVTTSEMENSANHPAHVNRHLPIKLGFKQGFQSNKDTDQVGQGQSTSPKIKEGKPEKVKSRWRRYSELDRESPVHSALSPSSDNVSSSTIQVESKPDDLSADSSQVEKTAHKEYDAWDPSCDLPVTSSEDGIKPEIPKKEKKEKQTVQNADVSSLTSTDVKTEEEDVSKKPPYEPIEENIYLGERKKTKRMKEVRRMLCDCTTSKEERDMGVKACGEDCLNRMLYIECGSRCLCGDHCTNRRFQKKQYADVEPFVTDWKGHGLRTKVALEPGDFVMEYVGEVLDYKQFKSRVKQQAKAKQEHHYFMALNSDEVIDASYKGNVSRYMNHSCDPNCETQKWTVNGVLRVGFFVKKHVEPMTELNFDYQFERYGKEAQKCFCGSENCRGTIGGSKQTPLRSNKKPEAEDKKKKPELFEDEMLDEELQFISELENGLRNKDHVLNICRLMVRAESPEHRTSILKCLEDTIEENCLRLFLDYHGLELLWSWITDNKEGPEEVKIMILSLLKKLPINNKNILKDSKILPLICRMAGRDENDDLSTVTNPVSVITKPQSILASANKDRSFKKRVKFADEASSSDNESHSSVTDTYGELGSSDMDFDSPQKESRKKEELYRQVLDKSLESGISSVAELSPADSTNKSDETGDSSDSLNIIPDSLQDVKTKSEKEEGAEFRTDIENRAEELLYLWKDLKELFRIPKKQLEERKRIEKALGKEKQMERFEMIQDRSKHRAAGWDTRIRKRKKPPPPPPPLDDDDRKALLPTPPKMSKEERRQIFEAQVKAQDEIAIKERQQQEAFLAQFYSDPNNFLYFNQNPHHPLYGMSTEEQLQILQSQDIEVQYQMVQGYDTQEAVEQYIDPNTGLPITVDQLQAMNQMHQQPEVMYTEDGQPIQQVWPQQQVTQPYIDAQGQLVQPQVPIQQQQDQQQLVYPGAVGQQQLVQHPVDVVQQPVAPVQGQQNIVYLPQVAPYSQLNVQSQLAVVQPVAVATTSTAEDDDPPPPPSPPKPKIEKLPPNWKSAKDSEGKIYYYHTVTRQTQWDPPAWDGATEDDSMDLDSPLYDDIIKSKSKKTTTAAADTSSEIAKKIKDQFRNKMSSYVVVCLNPYRKPDCKSGRITSTEEFKHLARKLTHHVMAKELKHCRHVEDLEVNENVKSKAKDYVKKYMGKFGSTYRKTGSPDI